MKSLALSVALLASLSWAGADIVVTQKIEGGGQSGEQTIRVKGDHARCDIAGSVSIIVDRSNGETTTLAHAQRGFLTLTPERSRAMVERMKRIRGGQESPKLEMTGKKEKIGEYPCELATADLGTVKMTYWLAKDYPNFEAFITQLDVLESAPLATAAAGLAPRTKDLPGMPMKILMEMGTQKITITLLSTKEENVDPAIFKIPAGYKEMPAPPEAAEPEKK